MADEAVSGQYAMVDGTAGLMQWNVARSRPSNAFKHSGTKGGTNRRKGVGSWQGGWTAQGGVPALLPGQSGTFIGYGGPSNHSMGGAGYRYSGFIFVTEVTINWDYTSNVPVSHTVAFVGHLGLARASGAALDDGIDGVEIESSICPMYFGAAQILSMKTASLKITADVKSYVNSDTDNETGRRGGSNIDWEAQFVLERADNTLSEGARDILKMYTGAAVFWELKWGQFREYSGITANRETGDIISQTAVFEMASNSSSDGSIGYVKAPGVVDYWPFA